MSALKICHISSVHPADDVRIFHKECKTLARHEGWNVHFVSNAPLDVGNSGVRFHALPNAAGQGRLKRMLFRTVQAYRLAKAVNADIYHFHDPELLPWGLLLKWQGKIVIYDAHEDVPRDILTKAWIPAPLRITVAMVTEWVENFIARRLDQVITATPFIRDRFLSIKAKAIDINNYPMLGELSPPAISKTQVKPQVCFTGAISAERGAIEMVSALAKIDVELQLAGSFSPVSLRSQVIKLPSWNKVIELGQVKRQQLPEIFANSIAGLVLFHPVPNNINAQPNKLFEYMSAGLPIIASHFPLWRHIIEEVNCGLCVDPLDTIAIAEAISWVNNHPEQAAQMGQNGLKAVHKHFNWESESLKLTALYEQLSQTI